MTLAYAPPRSRTHTVSLLDVEPALARFIAPADFSAVHRALRAPDVALQPGPFNPSALLAHGRGGFAAVIASGLVAREICVSGRSTLQLLGPGDVFTGAGAEMK